MKLLYNAIRISIFASLFFIGCKKEGGNPLADINNLTVGSYPTLTSVDNLNFDYSQISSSTVGIKVTQYKSSNTASDIKSIKVYGVKGASTDRTEWSLVKTVDYTGDATALSVTGAELGAALGVDPTSFSPGDYYTFYNEITTADGRTFDIVNSPGSLGTLSAYNAAFTWQAYITCPFTGGMEGDYEVQQDDWADWSVGDVVHVTDGPGANQINLTEVWPNLAYGDPVNPLLVNVDPANGVATVPLVTFGAYPTLTTAQGANASGASNTTPCGYVFSCTGFITLTMKVVYGSSSQGNLKLVLKKI